MINVVTFKVKGTSNLLMNNPSSMDHKGPTGTRTKEYDADNEAEIRLYRNENDQLYIPTIAFLNSLYNGASYEKIGKDSARSRISSSIFVMEDQTILLDKNSEKPITEYEIDTRYVVLQKKDRISRSRPLIKNWMCLVSFEIDDDYIQTDHILPLFNKSGRTIGVLDYRPQHRGPFGRYEVELYTNGKYQRKK